MSFGFGVGDFLDLYDRAKAIVDACRDGPPELRELSKEVETLQITMSRLKEDCKNPTSLLRRKGRSREKDMRQIITNCREILDEVQTFVNKHSTLAEPRNTGTNVAKRVWHAYQVGSADLDSIRGKLTFYTSTIDLFLDSLGAAALGRIEHKVDLIVAQLLNASIQEDEKIPDDTKSVLSLASDTPEAGAWNLLHSELVKAGISEGDIDDHRDRIVIYVKGLITDTLFDSDISSRLPITSQRLPIFPSNAAELDQETPLRMHMLVMRTYVGGKASMSLAIDKVQYGTFASQPACLILMDIGLQTAADHWVESRMFYSLHPRGEANSNLSILDSAPKSMVCNMNERGVWTRPVQSSVRFADAPREHISTREPDWTLRMRPHSAEWHFRANSERQISLDEDLKIGLLICHSNEPFDLEFKHSSTVKSGSLKLPMFGFGRSIPLHPEANESVLDDIDLHALLFKLNNVKDDVGYSEWI